MRYLMLSMFVPLTVFVSCGKEPTPLSKTKSMSGALSLELLTGDEEFERGPGALMGGLASPLVDPANPEEVFWDVSCSAFRVNPTDIVTAAHCVKDTLVFAPRWRTGGSNRMDYEVVPFGDSPRLVFNGSLVADAESSLKQEDAMKLLWLDKDRDIAVFRQNKAAAVKPKVAASISVGMPIILWSYPNGMPATKSTDCKILKYDSKTEQIWHDCDSLTGSSGGLITTEAGDIVGVHLKGGIKNSYSYFKAHGKFEDIEDLSLGNRGLALNMGALSLLGENRQN